MCGTTKMCLPSNMGKGTTPFLFVYRTSTIYRGLTPHLMLGVTLRFNDKGARKIELELNGTD
jgi:hypothetical protein